MIVGRDMKNEWEPQWESMTIEELFELRELMQDVHRKAEGPEG
jgi:hypothetical protein